GGAFAPLFARTARTVRLATALGAAAGCAAALAVALQVLITAHPLDAALPAVVAAAGGLLFHLDPLGAFFLAVVGIGGLPAAVYGFSYTEHYEGHRSLPVFGVMFNVFLLGMSLVPC